MTLPSHAIDPISSVNRALATPAPRRPLRTLVAGLLIIAGAATAAAQEDPRPVGGLNQAIPPLTSLPYSSPPGPDRVLVVLLTNEYQQGRGYRALPAMILRDRSTSVADFLEAASFGHMVVRGVDIYGTYTTRFDNLSGPYDGDAITADAMESLDADGVLPDWAAYRFFIIVVDDIWDPHGGEDSDGDGLPDLPNGGLAVRHRVIVEGEERTIPGVVIAGFLTDTARQFVHAVGHELGHSIALGFTHSGLLDCEGAQGDYFECRQGVSNGDRTDVMGNGGFYPGDRPRHYSAIFKRNAGWVPPSNVIGDELGVHILYPIERDLGPGFPQLITFRLDHQPPFDASPFSDSHLTIEYRSAEGYDEGLEPGVLVKLQGATQLWNLTESPLVEGGSFIDAHNRIRIEVLSLYDDAVAVSVESF
jgi:hypothetical protein